MPLRDLPDELLRVVFSELVADMRDQYDWDDWDAHMSADLPSQPFDLAAVCHRWRTIALDLSALWSIICFTLYDPSSVPSTLDCVSLMLERSGTASLDIVLGWQDFHWASKTADVDALCSALRNAAPRWRRFFLVVPDDLKHRDSDEDDREFFDMFLFRTPLLEEFSIVSTNWEKHVFRDGFPEYLPYCPRLLRLRTEMCNILPRAMNPHPGAPNRLQYLSVCCILPGKVLWQLLNLTPDLVKLELVLMSEPERPGIGTMRSLCLPRLEHMTLSIHSADYINMWMDHLRLPSLVSLQLDTANNATLAQLLPRLKGTVTTVRLVSDELPLGAEDARPLAALTRMSRLELDALLEWEFLGALEAPALDTLVLGELYQYDDEQEEEGEDGEAENLAQAVIDFARARGGRVRVKFADEPAADCDILRRVRHTLDRLPVPAHNT